MTKLRETLSSKTELSTERDDKLNRTNFACIKSHQAQLSSTESCQLCYWHKGQQTPSSNDDYFFVTLPETSSILSKFQVKKHNKVPEKYAEQSSDK